MIAIPFSQLEASQFTVKEAEERERENWSGMKHKASKACWKLGKAPSIELSLVTSLNLVLVKGQEAEKSKRRTVKKEEGKWLAK